MDWLPTLLGVVLVACAAANALLPLVRGAPQSSSTSDAQPVSVDRFELYRQVLELEFDYHVGKLSREDFQQLSSELLGQAGVSLHAEQTNLAELDEEIEREIAAARAAFAAARSARSERTAGTPS